MAPFFRYKRITPVNTDADANVVFFPFSDTPVYTMLGTGIPYAKQLCPLMETRPIPTPQIVQISNIDRPNLDQIVTPPLTNPSGGYGI